MPETTEVKPLPRWEALTPKGHTWGDDKEILKTLETIGERVATIEDALKTGKRVHRNALTVQDPSYFGARARVAYQFRERVDRIFDEEAVARGLAYVTRGLHQFRGSMR